jgi:hypothetical protein
MVILPLLLLTAASVAARGFEVASTAAPAELASAGAASDPARAERHFITAYGDGPFAFVEGDERQEPASLLPVFERLRRERIAEEAVTSPVESTDDGVPSDRRDP